MKVVGDEIRLSEAPESELKGKSFPIGSTESRVLARRLLENRRTPPVTHIIRFVQSDYEDLPPIPKPTTVSVPVDAPEHVAPAFPEAPPTLLEQAVLETEEQRRSRRLAHGYNGPLLPLANDGGGWWMRD